MGDGETSETSEVRHNRGWSRVQSVTDSPGV